MANGHQCPFILLATTKPFRLLEMSAFVVSFR
jgi:hypothetical protein